MKKPDNWDLDIECRQMTFAERSDPDGHEATRWVLKCWNRSAKKAHFNVGVRESIFWSEHNSLIFHLIQRGFVTLATLPGDSDLYCGWLAGDREAGLHWGFVKSEFRGDRIWERMLKASPKTAPYYTMLPHQTWLQGSLDKRDYIYNPFKLFEYRRQRNANHQSGVHGQSSTA